MKKFLSFSTVLLRRRSVFKLGSKVVLVTLAFSETLYNGMKLSMFVQFLLLVVGTVRGKVSKRVGVVEGMGSVTEIVGFKVLV